MPRILSALIGLATAAQLAGGQSVLENDQMRLEVIGLKRWTVAMIQDSLHRYAPGDSLLSHACAAILREKLKFADASVIYRTTTINGVATKPYLAVTVIEPQDSALVDYRKPFRHSLPTRREWAPVGRVFQRSNEAFQTAIQRPGFLSSTAPLSAADSGLRAALPLRRFVRAHAAAGDRRLALATLASDGNVDNRVAAAVILSSFAQYDSVWWALADALRDPDGRVSSTAAQVLSAMSHAQPGVVSWAPATAALRALLDGTNLFAHDEVMEVLTATHVDPYLTRALLGGEGGGFLVLAKLGAEDVVVRQAAHGFLVELAGMDFGDSPREWRRWLEQMGNYSIVAPGWDSTGAPGLRGSVSRRLVLPAGRQFTITLQTVGPGEFSSPPAVSTSAVRFLGERATTVHVPAGPTQVFRFEAVRRGSAVIAFRHDTSNRVVQDTVVVR